jgi:hypothetical protein
MLASVCRRIASGAGAAMFVSASVAAQSVSYIGGLQYASGDFIFNERAWTAYVSNGLSWSEGPLRVSASLPVVMQGSGWLQYSGTGMMIPSGGMSGSRLGSGSGTEPMSSGMHLGGMTPSRGMPFSRVGVGDPVGRIEVGVLRTAGERVAVRLVGATKAPLSDVGRGFGTGEWDIGTGASSLLRIHGATVLAEAMYWKLGKPPGTSLRNAMTYAVSIGRPLSGSRWSVLAAVSGASSLWDGIVGPAQAGLGVGYRLKSGGTMFATAAAGLTRTAPAISTGLGWRLPIGKAQQAQLRTP